MPSGRYYPDFHLAAATDSNRNNLRLSAVVPDTLPDNLLLSAAVPVLLPDNFRLSAAVPDSFLLSAAVQILPQDDFRLSAAVPVLLPDYLFSDSVLFVSAYNTVFLAVPVLLRTQSHAFCSARSYISHRFLIAFRNICKMPFLSLLSVCRSSLLCCQQRLHSLFFLCLSKLIQVVLISHIQLLC